MRTHEEGGPADLEERGWQALATEGAGAEFYREVLDDTVVMLLPGGLVLDDRAAIIEAMSGPPWSTYRIERLTEHHPTTDTGLVTYEVVARRGHGPEYAALIGSLYVRRPSGWRLTFHQQTPGRARTEDH
ncbi:DUF4440 domain-containing protein [Pseudonocardia xinjiangensis]|uniref:DUF4440 domain-containing protein n=1 Tax=Pseudonocardia xinjiangensis TaxID=75289 RepID=UPI003D8D5A35